MKRVLVSSDISRPAWIAPPLLLCLGWFRSAFRRPQTRAFRVDVARGLAITWSRRAGQAQRPLAHSSGSRSKRAWRLRDCVFTAPICVSRPTQAPSLPSSFPGFPAWRRHSCRRLRSDLDRCTQLIQAWRSGRARWSHQRAAECWSAGPTRRRSRSRPTVGSLRRRWCLRSCRGRCMSRNSVRPRRSPRRLEA
jgi:hypothetical protein